MLTPETIAVVKSTIPVLSEHGEALTRHFYERMFRENPEVRPFFNPAHQHAGTQQRALAGAICAFAENVDNLTALGAAVELVAHKHASLGILPEHYPVVGENLLASIREVLGDGATDAVIEAWGQAYGVLANILVEREKEIYGGHHARCGWKGFRSFAVRDKRRESDTITSFYLVPVEGSIIAPHLPGQYLTVRVPQPDGQVTMRNYSISDRPGRDYFRISVKREFAGNDAVPEGYVSNYLHDRLEVQGHLEVGPPCGEFTLDLNRARETDRPLVLASGGVGITPVLSMFHAAVEAELDRDIVFIHAAMCSRTHAFADEIAELAARHPRTTTHVRYSAPDSDDIQRGRCDSEGFVDRALINRLVPDSDCDVYFCGPKPFMINLLSNLKARGISEDRLRYEFFGPLQDINTTAQLEALPGHGQGLTH